MILPAAFHGQHFRHIPDNRCRLVLDILRQQQHLAAKQNKTIFRQEGSLILSDRKHHFYRVTVSDIHRLTKHLSTL